MVSAVSAPIALDHPQQTAIKRENARGVIIRIIFASGDANVERSSPQFSAHQILVFTVLLVRRFFVIKIGAREFSRQKNEMINEFSFANRMSIYRVVASRCVAATNFNFTDL
jgi:hypothetical protein